LKDEAMLRLKLNNECYLTINNILCHGIIVDLISITFNNLTRLTVRDQSAKRAKNAKYPTEAPTNGSPATTTQIRLVFIICRKYIKRFTDCFNGSRKTLDSSEEGNCQTR
jgi:hypothetical protein